MGPGEGRNRRARARNLEDDLEIWRDGEGGRGVLEGLEGVEKPIRNVRTIEEEAADFELVDGRDGGGLEGLDGLECEGRIVGEDGVQMAVSEAGSCALFEA